MKLEMRIGDAARYLGMPVTTLRMLAIDGWVNHRRSYASQMLFTASELLRVQMALKSYPGLGPTAAIRAWESHNSIHKHCGGNCSLLAKKYLTYHEDGWKIVLGNTEAGYTELPVNYCPICGKLLKKRKAAK